MSTVLSSTRAGLQTYRPTDALLAQPRQEPEHRLVHVVRGTVHLGKEGLPKRHLSFLEKELDSLPKAGYGKVGTGANPRIRQMQVEQLPAKKAGINRKVQKAR